jgi:1-deoxy-D-xylulose-5-phosphate reductoisomerase
LNAANEIAVEAFLERRISFPEIWQLVADAMNQSPHLARPTLDDIVGADNAARDHVRSALDNR